jgi:hypothetical protein
MTILVIAIIIIVAIIIYRKNQKCALPDDFPYKEEYTNAFIGYSMPKGLSTVETMKFLYENSHEVLVKMTKDKLYIGDESYGPIKLLQKQNDTDEPKYIYGLNNAGGIVCGSNMIGLFPPVVDKATTISVGETYTNVKKLIEEYKKCLADS